MVLKCTAQLRWHRKFSVSVQMSEPSRKTVLKLLVDCSKWLRLKLQSLCTQSKTHDVSKLHSSAQFQLIAYSRNCQSEHNG